MFLVFVLSVLGTFLVYSDPILNILIHNTLAANMQKQVSVPSGTNLISKQKTLLIHSAAHKLKPDVTSDLDAFRTP
jgi:hypothetical protein